jgi:arylformamidase
MFTAIIFPTNGDLFYIRKKWLALIWTLFFNWIIILTRLIVNNRFERINRLMRIIDLTQPISATMPVYPGTPPPLITASLTLEAHGFREAMLKMVSHTGTHIDAPAHMLASGATLDKLPIDTFFGLALIMDVSGSSGGEIPLSFFEPHQEKLTCCRFVILKSRHDRFWGSPKYFCDYPVLSVEAASYLGSLPSLFGLGVDMISIDAANNEDYPVHKIILGAGKIVVENLTNLDGISDELALLAVFPLKTPDADGSPVRAVAFQMT